ncbi:hypothetical protein [Nocardioides mangrovi]|uniref:Ig-like domain repeat protein n=1 Tax=Nocardioides mangrovi TaxID=2874580 RepID=A0ABS7UIM0_9ACTN|nr:hypothetical protein [Nocardioides mangrovi]MBZ5740851.1 hypothetical protein [Nocardioides mangrovi]
MVRRLTVLALVVGSLLVAGPAYADGRVTVTPGRIDPTYATTLTLSGSGFQSIRGGHGGIYVFFGTVEAGWQPSKGGVTGADYLYVPDSESKDNQGFQKYVAFPGSDTASSANGGTMSASGSWSTQLVVPGAVFQAYDRNGDVQTVDCRKVTCGVITIGAHGVTNSHNETFTPVGVGSAPTSTATSGATATASTSADPTAPASEAPTDGSTPVAAGPATLEVDRASAIAGHVLAFTATGLPAGAQVSAVFDDGAAGAGPFAVGADGRLAGVITLPAEVGAGTHELRLYGIDDPPSVSFAVQSPVAEDANPVDAAAESADDDARAAWLFAGAAALVLVLALVRLGWRYLRSRRAAA